MDIQNPCPQKFREVTERGLTRLSAFFCLCCLFPEFLSTNMTEPTESIWLCMKKLFFSWNIFHTSGNAFAPMWFLTLIVTYIQLATSCLWNEPHDTLRNLYFLTAMGFFHTQKYKYYPINIWLNTSVLSNNIFFSIHIYIYEWKQPGCKEALSGQWLPLHLSSGHCTYVGTFSKIVPIRPDVRLLFEMFPHGQVVVVRTIYSSS